VFVFQEPPPGALELRWRLFGIRFRVMPTFFLVAALIAYLLVGPNLKLIAIDVGCIFAAILFTEFVQALVYRSYGIRSAVVIQEFVGGGIYPETEPPSVLQRIAVALASPASSFLLFALVSYSNQRYQWSGTSREAEAAYFILWVVSLFWGIIGLLPIFPYPGGRILLELLNLLSPRHGLWLTLVISVVLGVAYIAYTAAVLLGYMASLRLPGGVWLPPSIIVSVFMAMTTFRNWDLLRLARAQQRGHRTDDYEDRSPWER
jgi:hypothetical protein